MITGVVIAKNESSCIERCVSSLRRVCEEVLVIDGFSEDQTVSIAQDAGAKVVTKEWLGFSATKNWGNEQASNPWILSLDADEVLSEELVQSIRNVELCESQVYEMNRLNRFRNKWIKHGGWYPDRKVRLFHRRFSRWEGGYVHERLASDSGVKKITLSGDILHFTTESEERFNKRNLRYASLKVDELISKGKKLNALTSALSSGFEWFKRYLLKKGFLDGKEGFDLANYHAKWKWARYQEYRARK